MAKRKRNYLNNQDLLREIHLSKISFCSFTDADTDSQQDFIVADSADIFDTQHVQIGKDEEGEPIMGDIPVIELAFAARAKRLTKLDIPTEIGDIALADIVFRVQTKEHLPLIPKKKSKSTLAKEQLAAASIALFEELLEDEDIVPEKTDPNIVMVPIRCNFPPFFHYRVTNVETHELTLVGKSHWKGDFATGEFCKTHGNITDKLAMMYLKLCERYGSRGNWRAYTYNDEMQGQSLVQLTQVGLQFNEFRSANPFSYFTQVCSNVFTGVFNIEKKMQSVRDDILEANGLVPSWSRQLENDNNKVELPEDFYKSQKNAYYKNKKNIS